MKLRTFTQSLLVLLVSSSFLAAAPANSTAPTDIIRSGLPMHIACHGGATRTEQNAGVPIDVPLNRGIDIILTNPQGNSTPSLWSSSSSWITSGLVSKAIPMGSRNITALVTPDNIVGLALEQTIPNNRRQFWFTPLALGPTTLTFNLVQSSKQSGASASSAPLQTISFSVNVIPAVDSPQRPSAAAPAAR